MNTERKGNNLPKERSPLSLLSGSPTEACAHGQVDGSDLAVCGAFRVRVSVVELGIVKNASAMERPLGQALSTCRKEKLTIDLS